MRSAGPSLRSSLRSRDSSSSSYNADPKEKIKDCCRKVVAFMCTQVGVGGLVVAYAIIGAFGFMNIEQKQGDGVYNTVGMYRNACAEELWNVTKKYNTFNSTAWRNETEAILLKFQNQLTQSVKLGYNARTISDTWSFPAALMFSLSVFTMIGYGNLVPRTDIGKGVTVLYAGIGIPLYILYFMNIGKILAQTFRWFYTWLYKCSTESRRGGSDVGDIDHDEDFPKTSRRVIVPSTACLWVIGLYIFTGTIMFAVWEEWTYMDSVYFCVTSLCKIGFGDLVPGANIHDYRSGSQTKLVINFVYLLLGMGIVAMCYNLMREEVRVKVKEISEDMGQCMEDLRIRLASCGSRKPPANENF